MLPCRTSLVSLVVSSGSDEMMIQRIVLFKLRDEYSNDDERAAFVERTRRDLGALTQVRALAVGVPADDASAASWDIAITLQFESMQDVNAYIADPDHRAYVDDYASPLIEVRKAWNFEL